MSTAKKTLIFIGDIIFFYVSLFAMLFVRYGKGYGSMLDEHLLPFSIILVFSAIGFYVVGLYDIKNLRNDSDFFKILFIGILVMFLSGLALFYLIPTFGIRPRFNLFLFSAIYLVITFLWRSLFNSLFIKRTAENIFLVGNSKAMDEIKLYIEKNPQLGYRIKGSADKTPDKESIKELDIERIILASHLRNDPKITSLALQCLKLGTDIENSEKFYEELFGKTPMSEIGESWFLENITTKRPLYTTAKNIIEFLLALMFFVILLPLDALIGILIKLTSKGPAIFKQKRVGKDGNIFYLYKFRTMTTWHGGSDGTPAWTEKNDPRITKLGKILRLTHLDEIPQLWNIIKGDISFVGPRSEREELAKTFESFPFYEMRHIVKPGLTGWAQINFRPSASLEDAYEKLQYDFYYLKNRSVVLDILIMIRTMKSFFVNPQ